MKPELQFTGRHVEYRQKVTIHRCTFVFDVAIDNLWFQHKSLHVHQVSALIARALDNVISALLTYFTSIPGLEHRRHIHVRLEEIEAAGGVFKAPFTVVVNPYACESAVDLERLLFHELVHYFLQDLETTPGISFFNYLTEGIPKALERLVYGFDDNTLHGFPYDIESELNIRYNAGGFMVWNLLTTGDRRNLTRAVTNDSDARSHVEQALREQAVDAEHYLRRFRFPHIDLTICLKPPVGDRQFIGCSFKPGRDSVPYVALLPPWERLELKKLGVDEYVLHALAPSLRPGFESAPAEFLPTLVEAYRRHKPFMSKLGR